MLKNPNSSAEFTGGPAFFLADFNVYDRDKREEYLNGFNPEDSSDIERLFDEFIFDSKRFTNLAAEHRFLLFMNLRDALNDDDYDFAALLADDDEGCFYLPSDWDIKNARGFFERLFSKVKEKWEKDLI